MHTSHAALQIDLKSSEMSNEIGAEMTMKEGVRERHMPALDPKLATLGEKQSMQPSHLILDFFSGDTVLPCHVVLVPLSQIGSERASNHLDLPDSQCCG